MKRILKGYQFSASWRRDLTPDDITVLEEEIEKGRAEVRLLPDQEWVGGEHVEVVWNESRFTVWPNAPNPHEEE